MDAGESGGSTNGIRAELNVVKKITRTTSCFNSATPRVPRRGGCPTPNWAIHPRAGPLCITAPSMDTELATMRLFTRRWANQPWKLVGAAEPAVVGKAGLGWGYSFLDVKQREEPEKIEGDKRGGDHRNR